MVQERREESWLSKCAETTINESNASLLDLVKDEKSNHKGKVYPENQISPWLSSFENALAKKREE